MAASKEWTQWHLTPRGWERGTVKTDYDRTERPTPDDRVLSCLFEEIISSAFSGLNREVSEFWSSSDTDIISELKQKYGECPNSL